MNAKGSFLDNDGKLNNFAIEPKMYVEEAAGTGFNPNAEKLNGRLAMIGFIAALATEALTGKGVVSFFIQIFQI
jgi:Chlorophyll A-B binding protein